MFRLLVAPFWGMCLILLCSSQIALFKDEGRLGCVNAVDFHRKLSPQHIQWELCPEVDCFCRDLSKHIFVYEVKCGDHLQFTSIKFDKIASIKARVEAVALNFAHAVWDVSTPISRKEMMTSSEGIPCSIIDVNCFLTDSELKRGGVSCIADLQLETWFICKVLTEHPYLSHFDRSFCNTNISSYLKLPDIRCVFSDVVHLENGLFQANRLDSENQRLDSTDREEAGSQFHKPPVGRRLFRAFLLIPGGFLFGLWGGGRLYDGRMVCGVLIVLVATLMVLSGFALLQFLDWPKTNDWWL